MNKLKELANKATYESACLMLDINGLLLKVDKKFALCHEDKEFWYGIVEDYRAGIRHEIGNWSAVKCIFNSWVTNLKLRIFKQTVIAVMKRKVEEA